MRGSVFARALAQVQVASSIGKNSKRISAVGNTVGVGITIEPDVFLIRGSNQCVSGARTVNVQTFAHYLLQLHLVANRRTWLAGVLLALPINLSNSIRK